MARILDLRSFDDHQKRILCVPAHPEASSLVDVVVVPIPISMVEKRSFELPARHIKFSILVSRPDLERAEAFLSGSNRKRPNPWRVAHVLLDTEELWSQAHEVGMVEKEHIQGPRERHHKKQRADQEDSIANTSDAPKTSRIGRFPLARLWQPDPMVETVLFSLLTKTYDSNQLNHASKAPLQVWDLAAGAGRDVAFLAEKLLAADKPYQIIAIDHRYNEKETKIVNEFWDRRGIRNQTKSMKMNLSDWKTLEEAMMSTLTTNKVAAMFCVRFWKADLVKFIAHSSTINSGVFFGISHFCKPSVGADWKFDHPSEKTVLERNQLSDLFKERWDIIYDEIALDSDHGRTMIHFVDRKSVV